MAFQMGKVLTLFLLMLSLLSSSAVAKETLPLDRFLKMVYAENPDFTIQNSDVNASKARASGIRIPPGMVGFMQMRESGNIRNGIEVYQEIPLPSKIIQDKRVRNLEYEAQKQVSGIQKTIIIAKARVAYIEFWAALTRLTILKEKRRWLGHHTELYRTTTFSDNQARIHLLGVESELDLLDNEILSADTFLTTKRNLLNVFVPSLENQDIVAVEPALEDPKTNGGKSPFVTWKEKELKAKQAELSLAKQAYLPDLSVRLRAYGGSQIVQANNELMVGITVPFLNFWQPNAEIKEASAKKMRANAELQKMTVETDSMFSSLFKQSGVLKKQLVILKNKLIPRAAQRVELVKNLSQRTMEGLGEHKSVMLDYLDLKLQAVDLRSDYEKNLQEIMQLIGG